MSRQYPLVLPLCFLIFLTAFGENPEMETFGSISGRVVDEISGKGVEGVPVAINIENRQTLTDRKGCFEFHRVLTDRQYLLHILIDRKPYFTRLHEVAVKMNGRKSVSLENIIAGHGGVIEGTIKRWDGKPEPDMSVTVYAKGENPGVYGGVPDKNGHYRVSKLPPDTELKVVACCWNVSKGCGRIVKEGVLVKKDKMTKAVDLVVPYNPTEISGKVMFHDGTPLPAHLTFWKDAEQMGNLSCDDRGRFSITALEAGNYKIHVGYGDEKKRMHCTREMAIGPGQKKKISVILSENSIEYQNRQNSGESGKNGNHSSEADLRPAPMAELKFSHNEAFSRELRDRVKRAYLDDIMIKTKSDCLPDGRPGSARMRMRNRLRDRSNPIYIIIEGKNKTHYSEYHLKLYRINRCGGAFKTTSIIYLYPASFTDECGSLAATLFHELLHLAEVEDDTAYAATKKCYGSQALEKPPRKVK